MNEFETLELLTGDEGIAQAVKLLKQGECVALPTETVYGLAADATQPEAVAKIFSAKGRPSNHPLIVHIPDETHIARWADSKPADLQKLADAFWPGPLTVILNTKAGLNNPVTGGKDTIALRVPSHPLFLKVLIDLDTGLAAPSANRYKQLSPTVPEQVVEQLTGRIPAVLEGGACEHGLESTILDLTSDELRVLRAGPISAAEIEQCLGKSVTTPMEHNEAVPGNVKAHYQPNAPVTLVKTAELTQAIQNEGNKNIAVLAYSEQVLAELYRLGLQPEFIKQIASDAAGYGKGLYYDLYCLDKLTPAKIFVETPPVSDDWQAVNNRLSRAASFEFIPE
ncbi:L-threonylcarbamoyladenylate synthase [Pseudoalteromonas sp. BZB3]|uniref:L-threonylcarbamoyladenylate synthase n=1 Tax=Pseudoalteromonas sp. BZB3 TaxID=3136670 RepID=UPI0032C45D83